MSTEQTAVQKRSGGFDAPAKVQQAAANTDAERAIAEVKGAITIAMANPRNQAAAVERIMSSCRRPNLAEKAIYAYPKGGTTVTGASIRLAEALAQNWGNFQSGWRELSSDANKSTVQTYAWDVETNSRFERVFDVPHFRYSRDKGNVRLTDPRDIYEMLANQAARRLRACILAAIPVDVVEMAVDECGKTQEAELAKSGRPKSEIIKSLLTSFQKYHVDRQIIEGYLKHKAEDMSNAEILAMGRIFTAIDVEGRKPEEYFATNKGKVTPDVRASVAEKAGQSKGPLGGIFNRGEKGKGKLDPERGERAPDPEEDEGQPELY